MHGLQSTKEPLGRAHIASENARRAAATLNASRPGQNEGCEGLFAVTESLVRAWEEAKDLYTAHRRLACRALVHDPQRQGVLEAYCSEERDLCDWVEQAAAFYTHILGDADVLINLARFGLTHDDIEMGLALVQHVAELGGAQEREKHKVRQWIKG